MVQWSKLTSQDQDSLLCSVSERENEMERETEKEWWARECCYIHSRSWGVHVMKTGHSRVVWTVGPFPSISGGTVLDICSAREPNEQGSLGSNLTEAACEVNEWNRFETAEGKAAVTYHLKSSWRRRKGRREPVLVGLEIIASHFSRVKVEKVENWVYWCDCGTPVVGMHVLRCSLKNTCGYEMSILPSHFSWNHA